MPKTVLLADDSVTIQKVVGISFANEDLELLTVDNGEDALAKAREARPDLVLADTVMPGKNGYELCEAIKTDPALRHIPVLLLSGTFVTFDEAEARRVGADGHITKPFEAQALVARVKALIERAGRATAGAAPPETAAPAAAVAADAGAAGEASDKAGDSGGNAYDFFNDDINDLPPLDEPPEAEDFDLATTDESLALGSDELQPVAAASDTPTKPNTSAAERTVAILADDVAMGDEPVADLLDSGFDLFDTPIDPSTATRPEAEPTILDAPTIGHISPPATGGDPMAAPAQDADLEATVLTDSALEFGLEAIPAPSPSAAPLDADANVTAQFSPSDLVPPPTETEVPEATEAPPAVAAPVPEPRPAVPPTPRPASEVGSGGASDARPASPEITPAMRQRIHDTLEKIAWEAFSDLSDTLVRRALERVEEIAWEVIPQMTETLVREEIRRMKDDPESKDT